MSSSLKLFDKFLPDFTWNLLFKRVLPICSNGSAQLNKMAAMPIYAGVRIFSGLVEFSGFDDFFEK